MNFWIGLLPGTVVHQHTPHSKSAHQLRPPPFARRDVPVHVDVHRVDVVPPLSLARGRPQGRRLCARGGPDVELRVLAAGEENAALYPSAPR